MSAAVSSRLKIFQQIFLLLGIGFSFGEFDVGFQIARERCKLFIRSQRSFRALALSQDVLRFFLIVPEIRVGGAFFQALQARAILRDVKDNSARG